MSLVTTRTIALGSTIAVLVVACVEEPPEPFAPLDEAVSRSGEAVPLPSNPDGGVWVNNGLHDPDVGGIDPDHSLASPEGLATAHGLLLEPDGRNVVRYLVECALPEGHGITKLVNGELLEFDGAIGLAPEWEDDACDEDCQEWVSACLLARTNVSEQTVYIWMRADHPAIGEGTSLLYPSWEASFFGNLFADSASQHFCQGTVVGPLLGRLHGRTCAALLGEPCGFEEYTLCELQQRCTFSTTAVLGLGVADSPANCIAGPLPGGPPFHTISTYVGAL